MKNINTNANIFQIICGKYKQLPTYIVSKWIEYAKKEHILFDETKSRDFLKTNFHNEYLEAFNPPNTKWKADLLRFCIMSKYSGIYSDVDLLPSDTFNNTPNNIVYYTYLYIYIYIYLS